MKNIEVLALVEKREILRKQKRYKEADIIRQKLMELGYSLSDEVNGPRILETLDSKKEPMIAIFGSGETSSIGRKVHEEVISHIGRKDINVAILTTPAGFQPNVVAVHEEIKEFLEQSLANFRLKVEIVYANTKEEVNDPKIVSQIDHADYLFLGPGSPTYVVDTMKESLLYKRIIEKVQQGASIGISSAAAIGFSRYCLPVYEIYKVGLPLRWIDGLNFYGKFYRDLTIIPHFNNTEGGKKTDTSRCFMGEERFTKLQELLPDNQEVWGIDEQTGVLIWGKEAEIVVLGKGKRHLLRSEY